MEMERTKREGGRARRETKQPCGGTAGARGRRQKGEGRKGKERRE